MMNLCRSPRGWIFPLLTFVAASACGDNWPDSSDSPVVRTWGLYSVDGRTIPFIVEQTPASTTCLAGAKLTIASGGTFAEVSVFRHTAANGLVSTDSTTVAGTWFEGIVPGQPASTALGTTLLRENGNLYATANITGGVEQLTVQRNGTTYVYCGGYSCLVLF